MVREWIFLQSVVADSEMALAKADMAIAARYADLAGSQHRGIFERIRSEYARTVDLVVGLKGTTSLLDEEPALRRSIYLRNPYVDPISLIQVDLLRQWRERGRPDDDAFQALLETVGGIALGLQNTG
jgi:phosphoenolpyruvate carboxylase